jgi:hypothetical protein
MTVLALATRLSFIIICPTFCVTHICLYHPYHSSFQDAQGDFGASEAACLLVTCDNFHTDPSRAGQPHPSSLLHHQRARQHRCREGRAGGAGAKEHRGAAEGRRPPVPNQDLGRVAEARYGERYSHMQNNAQRTTQYQHNMHQFTNPSPPSSRTRLPL